MCICLDILFHTIIVGEATPFFKFITTSRLLTGTELNLMDIRPAGSPLQLLTLCSKVGGCQAVDAQERHLMTNVGGVSATTGHTPTYVSTVNSILSIFDGDSIYLCTTSHSVTQCQYTQYNILVQCTQHYVQTNIFPVAECLLALHYHTSSKISFIAQTCNILAF